jgi:hypothetical protein
MQLTRYRESPHRQLGTTHKILYGKPMHLEPNVIYIVFQANSGDDLFILSYPWFKLNSGKKLYCRYGAMITPHRTYSRYPQMQSFVFFDAPIEEQHMHYIDGFLRLSQDSILVPAHAFDAETDGLMATSPQVCDFFLKCSNIHYCKEEFYSFSENVLLAMGKSNHIDYDTTAAIIMSLKEKSINPPAIGFSENKSYSKFLAGLTVEVERYLFDSPAGQEREAANNAHQI